MAEGLDQLTKWGNLQANPDTSRVTTVEDFYRARLLYQLSLEGEAAERALEVYENEIGRRGELQTVALEDIRVRLRALHGQSMSPEPDPAVTHSLLPELSGRLDSLAANASAFMSSLQRTIDLQDVDEEAFLAYKDRLIAYLDRFVSEHLVNDVASHLQELINDAEAQVEHMNSELEERPTSTGMRLRLRWLPRADGPAGLPEARARLLRQQAEMWSADDRAAVGGFLQSQIEVVRAQDEQGTWQEHLRKALDYRAWHRFTIERFADGRWRPATGPASGGERVLTVSLPLFAAASAHYRSAHPQAPRLVLLDEAFAGVDDDARGKCLGLLTTFDLDVMMTSERDWGFYATVPGIATHQLVRGRAGSGGVGAAARRCRGQPLG